MFEGLKAIREEIENATITNPDRDEIRDGYQLRFVGKDYAKFVSALPTETMLVPDTDWNSKDENKDSQNIFITGDNLDALKHLVNAYERQIKCIYIDPPYNTGSDGFVYNDTFNFTDAQLKEKLGMTDSDVTRLRALNGKCSHSAWLTFMLPRLILAKRMLAEDGVIFISIDDNEQANLKTLCDEIFNNFHGCLTWIKKTKPVNMGTAQFSIQSNIEYVLVYGRKAQDKHNYNLPQTESKNYPFEENGDRYRIESVDQRKNIGSMARPNMVYEVLGVNPKEGFRWQMSKEKRDELLNENKLFVKDGKLMKKIFEKDEEAYTLEPFWSHRIDTGTAEDAKEELEQLFGEDEVFETVKPSQLIKQILLFSTDKNDIILDFFAGSSTTADAVMQLNSEDNGSRKYIMVQLNEDVADGSEAKKHGYKTVDEISRKRIILSSKRLGDKSGFKHYKLAKISDNLVLDKIDNFDPTKPNLLADDMIKPFSGKDLGTGLNASGLETILTTWMVDDGYTLTTPVQEIKFGDYIAYSPKDSRRLYLISAGWATENTRELLNLIGRNELSVQTIIVYNHSFDFKTLTELKNNMKSVLEGNVEIIERF